MADDTPPPGCPAHTPHAVNGQGGAPDRGLRLEEVREEDLLHLDSEDAGGSDFYESARRTYGRVAPVALPGGSGERRRGWLLLGYAENLHVSRSSQFVRDSRRWSQHGTLTEDDPLAATLMYRRLVVMTDGEEHQRLRQAVVSGLETFNQRGIRSLITGYVDQLIDSFTLRGTADLMADFAQELTGRVIARLFYGPEADSVAEVDRFKEAAGDALRATATAADSFQWLAHTIERLVGRRRVQFEAGEKPHDLPSKLIAHGLTDEEVVQHLLLILMAGGTPTSDLIGNTLYVILSDEETAVQLRMGALTHKEAVTTGLWNRPPIANCPFRVATSGFSPRDDRYTIQSGDLIILGLGAANIDPEWRGADIRENQAHLAFGIGAHACPGADLGRAITEVAIERLLERVQDIRLAVPAEQLSWRVEWTAYGLESLPVEFSPDAVRSGSGDARMRIPVPAGVEGRSPAVPGTGRPY